MAVSKKPHRRLLLLRLHRILPILYPKLLTCRMTPIRSDKEGDTMDLDRSPNKSLRNPENADVLKTGTDSTTIRQTIRSSHRRIGIWRGRHTLTRGRHQPPKTLKTTPPPHCILLSDIHTH